MGNIHLTLSFPRFEQNNLEAKFVRWMMLTYMYQWTTSDVTSGIPNLVTLNNKKQERATAQKQQQMRQ